MNNALEAHWYYYITFLKAKQKNSTRGGRTKEERKEAVLMSIEEKAVK